MPNPRKPKALKNFESDRPIRKDRQYNTLESEMNLPVELVDIRPSSLLSGKALELWNQLVPGLIGIGLVAAQDKMNLDSVFFLYQELLHAQDDLSKARKRKNPDEIDKANSQLVRTTKALSGVIAQLGLSPKDRTYFKSTDKSGNAIDDILGAQWLN